jgi:hypothetical protein
MAYQKKWDWEAVRLEYIIGELVTDEYGNETRKPYSTKRLAEKHGIPFNTLADRCHKDKWVQDKNRLDIELKRRVTEDKVTQIFGESVISSSYTLKQLGKINQIIDAYLQPYLDLVEEDSNKNLSTPIISEYGYSDTEVLRDESEKKINPRDIKDIVSIIKEVHNLKKSILGEEQLQVAVEDIKIKDKAKSISKLKGGKEIESQLDMLLKEKQKVQARLSSSNNNSESNNHQELDEDDE